MSGWAWVVMGVGIWATGGVFLAFAVGRALRRLNERAYRNLPGGVPTEGAPTEGDASPGRVDETTR